MTMKSSLFAHIRHPHQRRNVNEIIAERMTFGDRMADAVAATVGSWRFIIIQSALLAAWIILNSLALFVWKWDPAPFILLNLCLSFQAAFTAPIIMMSQNRQATKDRLVADETHASALKDEIETRQVIEHLIAQDTELGHQTEELLKHTRLLLQLVPDQGLRNSEQGAEPGGALC